MAYLPQTQPSALQPAGSTSDNSLALGQLARAITLSQGQFSLILACCESAPLQQEIASQLLELTGMELWELKMPRSTLTLLATIEQSLPIQPAGLLVGGLESVIGLDSLLRATNLARNEFAQKFHFPLVLWVNESILQKLRRIAPDFRSWASNPIHFTANPNSEARATRRGPRSQPARALTPPTMHWREPALRFEKFQPPSPGLEPSPRIVPLATSNSLAREATSELCILEPRSLEEMESAIAALRSRKCAILKMAGMDREEAQRALDFLVGGTYAIDGDQLKLAEALFLFTPNSVRISAG